MIGINKERRKGEPNDFPAPHSHGDVCASREYSNPFTPRNAYARGRAKGAVDQSLARVPLTRLGRTHGIPLRRSYLSPCKYVHMCVYISYVYMHMYLHMNAYRVYHEKIKIDSRVF